MSRPGSLPGTSGPGPVGPADSPVRVVAERITEDDLRAAEAAEAARRAAARAGAPTTVLTATPVPTVARLRPAGGPAQASPATGPASPATGLASPATGLATLDRPPELPPPSALPVPVALPPRRSGFAELLALITGRRRTGRHRPDCVHRQSWTMFSPRRRPRARGRFRARV